MLQKKYYFCSDILQSGCVIISSSLDWAKSNIVQVDFCLHSGISPSLPLLLHAAPSICSGNFPNSSEQIFGARLAAGVKRGRGNSLVRVEVHSVCAQTP